MTEAMPFLQRCDITFLRPPPITAVGFRHYEPFRHHEPFHRRDAFVGQYSFRRHCPFLTVPVHHSKNKGLFPGLINNLNKLNNNTYKGSYHKAGDIAVSQQQLCNANSHQQ